jgi:heptosyltransferase-2
MIKTNCIHFKGYSPCKYNKEFGYECYSCNYYAEIDTRILIVKLDGIGDIIRTTPILHRFFSIYKNPKIYWLSNHSEVLPDNIESLSYNFKSIEILRNINFDLIINLDKEMSVCAFAQSLKSRNLIGFRLENGVVVCTPSAFHKYKTGVFDRVSKENSKHYVEEIFDIIFIEPFNGEEYILPSFKKEEVWLDKSKYVIGLNTGYGQRWSTRCWDIHNWKNLSRKLLESGYEVVLLGGEREDKINKVISDLSGAKYLGYGTYNKFINLVDNCDLIVTQVTSALHVAIGLKKRIVLMNNVFNKNEFYLYGLGEIIEPVEKCECYYLDKCKKENSCMSSITVEMIIDAIERQRKC